MNIYLDLETVGTEDAAVIEEITAGITPPKSMSKPETIARWEREDRPALIEEAIAKTAFDGTYGRIVCIGWAVGEGKVQALTNEAEEPLLTAFYAHVSQALNMDYRGGILERTPVFIGHNIAGFDLRFLWQRSVVNRVKYPSAIPFHAKPWDTTIGDTMLMWHPERDRRISLDRLCRALGVASPKSAMDGSEVWAMVKAGRWEEVASYCCGDVAAVRECYKRMRFL